MSKHKGGAGPAFHVTPGNIMTPVAAFSTGIFSGGPAPSARGANKAPGEDAFPVRSGAKSNSTPLKALGLGGKEK